MAATYTVKTYDVSLGEYTHHNPSKRIYTVGELRQVLKQLRNSGYDASRQDPSINVEKITHRKAHSTLFAQPIGQ